MANRPVACVPEENSAPKQRKPKKGSSSKKNMHNKDLGRKGEEAAARYLVRRGYDIVERNWTCIAGEADIIALDGDTIVFVEVKTRTSAANGLPGEAVTKEKRARYEKIACLYLEAFRGNRRAGPLRRRRAHPYRIRPRIHSPPYRCVRGWLVMYGRCTVLGATLRGVEAIPVDVEVAVSNGLPGFSIVGMGDASVQEARERVRAALRSSGFQMPSDKIVVNLAPSSLRKTGSGLDLPIAVALLAATGQIDRACIENRLFVGELSLKGFVRGVAGSLAFALCAKKRGCSLVCAEDGETVSVDGLAQYGLRFLGGMRAAADLPLLSPLVPESAACRSRFSRCRRA